MQKFIYWEFSGSTWIKVLQQHCRFIFFKFNTKLSKAIFQVYGVNHTIYDSSSKGNSQCSKTISWGFILASLNDPGWEFAQIADEDLLGNIRIMHVKISSLGLSECALMSFLLEVDVSIEARDGLGLVGSLSETRGSWEGVGSYSCGHVVILPVQVWGPVSDRLLLGVVSLWDFSIEFFIWLSLTTSPGAMLHDKLLITLV